VKIGDSLLLLVQMKEKNLKGKAQKVPTSKAES
jgi:hypothetical protein